MSYLIIDIETIPNQTRPAPDFDPASVKVGNLKDQDKIDAKIAEAKAEWDTGISKKMSVDSDLCEIVSLGMLSVKDSGEVIKRTTVYYDEGDKVICEIFRDAYRKHDKIIGWNSKYFDIPILWKRGLFHGKPFTDALTYARLCTPWDNGYHIDLRRIFYADRMEGSKLSDCCRFFGIPCKTGMDGSMIYDAYKAGRHDDIQIYNLEDCDVTLEIARRLGIITQAF